MDKQITLYEWLQTTFLSPECCIDLVTVDDNGSEYHLLETNESALKKESELRFAKRFSAVTYKELKPFLDSIYESSYVYGVSSDLIIVEVKIRPKREDDLSYE